MKRNIIKIDLNKCTGCGECVPACPEGAIQMIDGKARLVSDLHCDGLGACIGDCPVGAIETEFREAEPYNEREVVGNIIPQGDNVLKAHLEHLYNHGEMGLYREAIEVLKEKNLEIPIGFNEKGKIPEKLLIKPGEFKMEGCASGECSSKSSNEAEFDSIPQKIESSKNSPISKSLSNTNEIFLTNWPFKIKLTQTKAHYFSNANLLIAADCVAASIPNFQKRFLNGKILLMGCPKFDDQVYYIEKLAQIFTQNSIQSLHVVIMEVPCCSSFIQIIKKALQLAEKEGKIPVTSEIVPIDLAN